MAVLWGSVRYQGSFNSARTHLMHLSLTYLLHYVMAVEFALRLNHSVWKTLPR
jgi:hypothetical protein